MLVNGSKLAPTSVDSGLKGISFKCLSSYANVIDTIVENSAKWKETSHAKVWPSTMHGTPLLLPDPNSTLSVSATLQLRVTAGGNNGGLPDPIPPCSRRGAQYLADSDSDDKPTTADDEGHDLLGEFARDRSPHARNHQTLHERTSAHKSRGRTVSKRGDSHTLENASKIQRCNDCDNHSDADIVDYTW